MGYKGSRGVFGCPPHRCYDLIYMLEKELGTKFSVLISDCYETNDILINDGIIDNYYMIGLKQKIFMQIYKRIQKYIKVILFKE